MQFITSTLLAAVVVLVGLVIIEVALCVLIGRLRKGFPWLITSRDRSPSISPSGLESFISHGYDPVLGWVRKPNTQKCEPVTSAGEVCDNPRMSRYSIDAHGSRGNPGHEHLPALISSYGDSFAFSKHVNDDESWQYHLAEMANIHVTNYGVGNYGLDQALVRLKQQYESAPTPIVIMMVVPETISRIVNVWKHYSEYGNTLGFKGRYVHDGDELQWLPNPIDDRREFARIHEHLEWLQANDDCYRQKFQRDLLRFPFLASVMRNPRRHAPLLLALTCRTIAKTVGSKSPGLHNWPWKLVLRRNFQFARDLYSQSECVNLLVKIARDFRDVVQHHGGVPVFVMAPYRQDVVFRKQHGRTYYDAIVRQLRKAMLTIDLSETLVDEPDLSSLYVSDFYGAHFSDRGNQLVAKAVLQALTVNTQTAGILSKHGQAAA